MFLVGNRSRFSVYRLTNNMYEYMHAWTRPIMWSAHFIYGTFCTLPFASADVYNMAACIGYQFTNSLLFLFIDVIACNNIDNEIMLSFSLLKYYILKQIKTSSNFCSKFSTLLTKHYALLISLVFVVVQCFNLSRVCVCVVFSLSRINHMFLIFTKML